MSEPRPDPVALVFGTLGDERFPAIRDALGPKRGVDEFMLVAPALELLRDLRPDEGLGDAVDDFVAFVHAAYLFWHDGARTRTLDASATRALCEGEAPRDEGEAASGGAMYIQVAPRLIWGKLADGETYEPLDGWFAERVGRALRVVACFGVHPSRPGLTVVAVAGESPSIVGRADGSSPFAPTMPGGDAAGLHAIASPEELLLLAWRANGREES